MNSHPLWLYWGGQHMTWLRYMTVRSAVAIHSNVILVLRREPHEQPPEVNAWLEDQELRHAQSDGEDWLARAAAVAHQVVYLEDVAPELAAGRFSDVHVSDLLSYWLLGRHGGTVADMDILFFASPPEIVADVQVTVQKVGLRGEPYVPVGFMQGRPSHAWMDVYREGIRVCNPSDYQSAGSHLISHRGWQPTLPPTIVYPFAGKKWAVAKYWYFQGGKHPEFPAETIGVHWYAGGHQHWVRTIKGPGDLKHGAVKTALGLMEAREEESLT